MKEEEIGENNYSIHVTEEEMMEEYYSIHGHYPHIVNATRHPASSDQVAAGVVEPQDHAKEDMIDIMTFDECPPGHVVTEKARRFAKIVVDQVERHQAAKVMIGGAPFFMSPVVEAIKDVAPYIEVVYAFSQREAVETIEDDGSVTKKTVFVHKGFVPAV
jgi:hypothetical protein